MPDYTPAHWTHDVEWRDRYIAGDWFSEPVHGQWSPITRAPECDRCHYLEDHPEEIPALPAPPEPEWDRLHDVARPTTPGPVTYPRSPCPRHGYRHPHRWIPRIVRLTPS